MKTDKTKSQLIEAIEFNKETFMQTCAKLSQDNIPEDRLFLLNQDVAYFRTMFTRSMRDFLALPDLLMSEVEAIRDRLPLSLQIIADKLIKKFIEN